jgi:hypothetical protein
MNTHGHGDVINEAGVPLLQQAFEAAGKGKPRVGAFHLGNWLTDVSQVIEPVGFAGAASKLRETAGRLDEALGDLMQSLFTERDGHLIPLVFPPESRESARKEVITLLETFAAALEGPLQENWNGSWTDIFRLVGYFKFVHPPAAGQAQRMDFSIYNLLFSEFFLRYIPHLHVDRPEVFPRKTPAEFESTLAAGTRSPRHRVKLQPDLYSYLRDHIEITAGSLAEIDLYWASSTFTQSGAVNDGDYEWNHWLARLGVALHAVEDFFAHSNFIELATIRLGEQYRPESYQLLDAWRFARRLKRYEPISIDDWRRYAEEDHVVTGFFEVDDTLVSIGHVGEELFGPTAVLYTKHRFKQRAHSRWQRKISKDAEAMEDAFYDRMLELKDPTRIGRDTLDRLRQAKESPATVMFHFHRLMRHTLDTVTDPERAFKDETNPVAQALRKKYADPQAIEAIRSPLVKKEIAEQVVRDSFLFQDSPPEIRTLFVNSILILGKGLKIGKQIITWYETIKNLIEFIDKPAEWIAKHLIIKGLSQVAIIPSAFLFYARDGLYHLLGADRIGSHSLLAKDYGREWLYRHQKECAKAVHWYILHTMTRWSQPDFRVDPRAGTHQWVDWLELLEYFLRNPWSYQTASHTAQVTIPVTIVHRVRERPRGTRPDMLSSLADLYRPQAVNPGRFTWRTIADANFDTYDLPEKLAQEVINYRLKVTGTGYPVTPPNYAFKTGTRVYIPDMKLTLRVQAVLRQDEIWYGEVLDKGWTVFRGREDPETRRPEGPAKFHTPVLINQVELQRLIDRGLILRTQAERNYVPSRVAGP